MPKNERCPFCGASVKSENLVRHLDTNHPRNAEARDLRTKLKQETGRKPAAGSRVPFRLRKIHIAVVCIVAALVLGAYYVAPILTPTSADIVSYCGGEATAQHYHTLLDIYINGVRKDVPAEIGISPTETKPAYVCPSGELHMLHTHDASGIIHNELPGFVKTTPTLGDFFTIWGQPLTGASVWVYSGTLSAHVVDMGTGQTKDYSSSPGTIPLYPAAGGTDSFAIPQYLLGTGTGQSGGYFSGEIVFLNVTSG